MTVRVTDKSSSDVTQWLWEWGDTTTDTGKSPPDHTYTLPGDYTIKLTVTNGNGDTDVKMVPVTIAPTP